MSEFKAQILGLIIVLSVFVFVKNISGDLFDQAQYRVEQYFSTQVTSVIGVENN